MIDLEVWLYGPLARYAGEQTKGSHAQLRLSVQEGTTMVDLLQILGMPLSEKSITFVNGNLTDMPGLASDLEFQFKHGDRVAFLHKRTMWPFHYRFGSSTSTDLKEAVLRQPDGAIHHTHRTRDVEVNDDGGGKAEGRS